MMNSFSVYISLVIDTILIFGIIVYFIISKKNVCRELGLRKVPLYVLPLCAILGYSMQYVMGLILSLIPWPETLIQNLEESYAGIDSAGLIITIISVSIVTGFTEELIFRVLPMSRLGKAFGVVFSVTISSIIFGIAHATPIAIFYTTILGALLGIIYHKYKSIWPCAIVHMFFNLASIIGLPITSPTFVLAFYFTSISFAVLSGYFILRNPAIE
jgi:membrane protease YdiL (CAAX protease family)